jgi:hypothetical protein
MTAARVRRTFVATPVRQAAATWRAIADVIALPGAPGRGELTAFEGIAASLVAAEAWRNAPLIISGVGPQLRVYCLYDEDAIIDDDTNENALAWSPTDGDWSAEVPCPPEDLDWIRTALTELSDRINVVDNTAPRTLALAEAAAEHLPVIDAERFLRG